MIALRYLLCEGSDELPGDGWLGAGERRVLAGLRLDARRTSWRLGRWTAKLALRACAAPDAALDDLEVRAADDGAPEAFLRGAPLGWGISLTHRAGRAAAVVGPLGVGFGCDLESVEPRSAAFVDDFFTDAERAWVWALPDAERPWAASLVWSAKESVLKALRVGLREDTRAVEVACAPAPPRGDAGRLPGGALRWQPLRARVAATGQRFDGFWCALAGQVFTLAAAAPMATPIPIVRGADGDVIARC